jgi:membrane fusion protein (multidrug efflux system)
MKKNTRIGAIILGVLILLFLLSSPRIRKMLPWSESAASSGRVDSRLPVSAVIAQPQRLDDKVRATGTVLADEEVELRSEITGKVERIMFREGTTVRRGDVLVKIDDSELQAQLLKLDSQLKLAQDKERRRRQLFEKQNISSEDYEITLNELNAVKAEYQLVEARIKKTELHAPFDGLIGLRFVSEGSYVSPNTRIASLQNVRKVKVDFSVPERYVKEVRKGQRIYFRLAGQEAQFEGRIFAIEPKIDPVTRSVLLRAESANDQGLIVPGAFAEVELILQTYQDALLIPTEAIVPDNEGQKVYLHRSGTALESRVEIGIRTESSVQITRGVEAGDTVLVSGLLQVVTGSPLRLLEVR